MAPRRYQPAAHTAIADALRTRLASEWPPETRLPSRAALAAEYGVSDHVVQRAQEVLIGEGVLEGRPGDGTYTVQPRHRHPLRLDLNGQFGLRPGVPGDWTVLCRRPGPVTIAYFADGQPRLLARAATELASRPEPVVRAEIAEPDDALVLGLLRGAPVLHIQTTDGADQPMIVIAPGKYWDLLLP